MKDEIRLGAFLLVGVLLLFVMVACSGEGSSETAPSATVAQQAWPVGPVTTCQGLPQFVGEVDETTQLAIDTTQSSVIGLALRDMRTGEVLQHNSWSAAGAVGAFVRDRAGNIYLAPTPFVQQAEPVETDQDRVLFVVSETGVMSTFVALPRPESDTANPFGASGLAFDCNTNLLYAASLAGSSREAELGAIYVIDLDLDDIIGRMDGVDALGLVVFNGRSGKRLYYGSARTPDVFSVALDEAGVPVGEPRFEFSLAQLSEGSVEHAMRLQIAPNNEMTVKAYLFNFAPVISSDLARTVYTLSYDLSADRWQLVSIDEEQ